MNRIRHTTDVESRSQPLRPFTVLLESEHSPYAYLYPPSSFDEQKMVLNALGVRDDLAIRHGIRELHDRKKGYSGVTMPGAFRLPQSNDGTNIRTTSLTIANPEIFAGAARNGVAPFDKPRMQAMAELVIAMGAPMTEAEKAAHHLAIDANLEAYSYVPETE